MDPRMEQLARNLVVNSIEAKPGEKVLIEANDLVCVPLVKALVKEVYRAEAIPFVRYEVAEVNRLLLMNSTSEQMKLQFRGDVELMEEMDASIALRGMVNAAEMSDVPGEGMGHYTETRAMLRKNRMKLKWVLLRYPNAPLAQLANMSTEAYEDYFYKICNLDYKKLAEVAKPLKELMERTDKVHIVSPGTDLTFSIKGIPAVICSGECNIPDGEVYTAPIKDSVNGTITFNLPSIFQDICFEHVKLVLKNGKIVEASCNHTEALNRILDTDEGSRFIGEFAIGINPFVNKCLLDGSIDEKMFGSFHFTPGNYCDGTDNGNISDIHWDLVLAQLAEYGGGEIYFDDVLIRKDGFFVIDELKNLDNFTDF